MALPSAAIRDLIMGMIDCSSPGNRVKPGIEISTSSFLLDRIVLWQKW